MDTERNAPTKPAPLLPTNRAFVVRFRLPSNMDLWLWEGHVEHLVSGQVVHFRSWEELRFFIERTLRSVVEKPP